jgi:hypothetical protein
LTASRPCRPRSVPPMAARRSNGRAGKENSIGGAYRDRTSAQHTANCIFGGLFQKELTRLGMVNGLGLGHRRPDRQDAGA